MLSATITAVCHWFSWWNAVRAHAYSHTFTNHECNYYILQWILGKLPSSQVHHWMMKTSTKKRLWWRFYMLECISFHWHSIHSCDLVASATVNWHMRWTNDQHIYHNHCLPEYFIIHSSYITIMEVLQSY